MAVSILSEAKDRIIIRLDAGQSVEIGDLADSFAAIARLYERHHRQNGEEAPKLYVARLETGSVIAEIAPMIVIMGALAVMDGSIIVSEFARRLSVAIKAFANPGTDPASEKDAPSRDDARDIREFVKPLTGRPGATLSVSHARIEKTEGDRKLIAEYKFDEAEINRAALNIDRQLEAPAMAPMLLPQQRSRILTEVMLFFDQASRRAGKEKGRTGDLGIISDITDKPLPVYFRKSFQDLKDKMVRGDVNPMTHAFVVDVHVQILDGEPKGYVVTEVHSVIPLDDE